MKTKIFMIILSVLMVAGFLVLGTALKSKQVTASKPYSTNTADNTLNTLSTQNAGQASASGDVQTAKLSMKGGTYILEPSVLKSGVPVKITADMNTIFGCMKTVVIKDFGVTKTLSSSDNTITFTPNKEGEFVMTCGMGMGKGTFKVAKNPNTVAPVVQSAQAANAGSNTATGGSCGMNGGGCGCGMMG